MFGLEALPQNPDASPLTAPFLYPSIIALVFLFFKKISESSTSEKTQGQDPTGFSSQGRYAQAEPLCKRAPAIHEKVPGPDHPDVSTLLANMAAIRAAKR